MGLVLYATMSWLCIIFLLTTMKKNEIIKSTIIYLSLTIIFVVIYIYMLLNLQLISLSDKLDSHLAVMLHGNMVKPLLMISLINKLDRLISYKRKIATIIFILLILIILELVNIKLKVYTYSMGVLSIPIVISFLYIFTTLVLNKFIYFIESRSEISR